MTLLTPPSTSHRAEKENATKFAFSLNMNIDAPKLTVSTASNKSTCSSSASTSSTATPVAETPSSASSLRNVVWSSENSYHSLATPPKPRPTAATTNAMLKERPVKPILKRRRTTPLKDATNGDQVDSPESACSADAMLDLPEDLDSFFRQREATPEPSDPLCDLSYLDYPVSLIVKPDAKLRELTEGYSILSARLRGTVQYTTDADASWPLFQPLRKNRDAFVECVVRDLERAFVDPINSADCPKGDGDIPNENWDLEESTGDVTLPSPKQSPKKVKKKGMSAEQVKFARDLCTTAHSVIKLLCVLLCFPAIHGVFDNKQLRAMLCALLAIPIAGDLPTPNSRKTCALTIMVLQCQRLPEDILMPARDRIAHALKRGIDGELGKEGKKGSANDGLKAIGDLSIYQPSTFVPVFAKAMILPSILQNLLAPTLALRIQACHALGGLAYGLAGLPASNIHAAASDMVSDFLLAEPNTPTKAKASTPGKEGNAGLSPILRTLRTTMGAQDATHVAHSPVWALCVCASLIVLLGSKMYTDSKVSRTIMSVFKTGAKHKKAAIRHLFCAVWRSVNWAWFQPDYDLLKDEGESERDEEDEECARPKSKDMAAKKKTREAYFDLMNEIVETQAALSTVAALLSSPPPPAKHFGIDENPEDALRRALRLLDNMANSPNPDTINDAAEALQNLVVPSDSKRDFTQPTKMFEENARAILPLRLFAQPQANGAIFCDLSITGSGANSLMAAVRGIFDQLPSVEDLRALTKEELCRPWVVEGVMKVWKSLLSTLEMTDDAQVSPEISQVWEHLLLSNLAALQDDDSQTERLTLRVADVLIDIITDPAIDFTVKSGNPNTKEKEPSGPTFCTNGELKVRVITSLWATARALFSRGGLAAASFKLLDALLANAKALTAPRKKKVRAFSANNNHIIAPVAAWAGLCTTTIVSVGDGESDATDAMKMFWRIGTEDIAHWDVLPVLDQNETKISVWKSCVDTWRGDEGYWETAVVLLAVPFIRMEDDEREWSISSEEGAKWKDLYDWTFNKALDHSMDASVTTVVDAVAELVNSNMSTSTSAAALIHAADLFVDHLKTSEMREVPSHLISLLDAIMKQAYPVTEDNMRASEWFIQALTRWVETTPVDLIQDVIAGLSESMSLWLRDESSVWSDEALDYTFLALYQHLLLRIQSLPEDLGFLSLISPLLDSVFSGRSMSQALRTSFKDAFEQFWELSPYSKLEEPAGGWPIPLQHCLHLEEHASLLPEVPSTPSRKAGKAAGDVAFPRTPMVAMNGSNIASPRRPHKPHADPSDPFLPMLPFDRSPLSPIRRRRLSSGASSEGRFGGSSSLQASPFSRHGGIRFPTGSSPSKRRRSLDYDDEKHGEKENSSPLASPKRRRTVLLGRQLDLTPIPIHERIASDSSTSEKKKVKARDRTNGKKTKTKDVGSGRALTARARPASPALSESSGVGSDDSDDERGWVERELVPFPAPDEAAPTHDSPAVPTKVEEKELEPQTPSKKRKRMSIETGLVPASEMVDLDPVVRPKARKLVHSASFDASGDRASRIPEAWTTPLSSGRSMKRNVTGPMSMSKASGLDVMKWARQMKKQGLMSSAVQPANVEDDPNDDPFEVEVTTNTPLPALRIVTRAPSPEPSSDMPSSDDSLHLGQVTPHHLISPALRVYSSKKVKAAADLTSTFANEQSSTVKLSASKQCALRGSRGGDAVAMPGSDDSVSDGAPDSSPTKKLVERRRTLGLHRLPSLTDALTKL
ncbi:hypothetical protein BKA70DRAFT_1144954 [Coprinopsis sp. MPI-PUGE-AT-0042]|nr:hypothetical protein BKA70DRAFT_1144954 [Coprinopsis sp. MPI-PUGE-AT-0042]